MPEEQQTEQKSEPKRRYRVEYERVGCIGAAACAAVSPEFWKIVEDGKADLTGAKKLDNNKKQELEITEKELERMKEAAESCPVNIIHIIDTETGERII